MNTDIHQIPISEIKPFVSRARPSEPFNRLKQSIKEMGLRVPIQVRELPRRRDGYKYELICGQGRMQACKELRLEKIPALIIDVPEEQVVGRFLAENVLRKNLSWAEKARLIQADVKRVGSDPNKQELEALANRYFITPAHVLKLFKILQKASPKAKDMLDDLTVTEAEQLTSLPRRGQDIVLEMLESEGMDKSQLIPIAKQAKKIAEEGKELSKTALKQSLRRVTEDLDRVRKSLKLLRLHHSLGPVNVLSLLSDKSFRKEMDKAKINYSKFEEAATS